MKPTAQRNKENPEDQKIASGSKKRKLDGNRGVWWGWGRLCVKRGCGATLVAGDGEMTRWFKKEEPWRSKPGRRVGSGRQMTQPGWRTGVAGIGMAGIGVAGWHHRDWRERQLVMPLEGRLEAIKRAYPQPATQFWEGDPLLTPHSNNHS